MLPHNTQFATEIHTPSRMICGREALALYPIQYRLEVETSGSSDSAVAAGRQQRRAKSAGVAHPSEEWGRLSL
jgi:hypothetical protein